MVVVRWLIWMGILGGGPSVLAEDLQTLKSGVVRITTKTGQVGTGFIVRSEPDVAYIITAAHVIAGDPHPEMEFFDKRHEPVNGSVLPGAELNDDLRGLALIVVRGREHIPESVMALSFRQSDELVSGGEEALVIGHPGDGGDWAILKRQISNRIGRDIALNPSVDSRFSGGPIILGSHVAGIVMSTREGFGLGLTHKSVLDYLEGFNVVPPPFKKPRLEEKARELEGNGRTHKPENQPILPKTITGKDGAPMVLVPAGTFTMGSLEGVGEEDEHPEHEVFLKDFYIDQYEVTVERYQQFLTETKRATPRWWDQVEWKRDAQKPVVGVNWPDAHLYCEWAGKRLPTEAEWEKAARGTDKRTFPWGESVPKTSITNLEKVSSENPYKNRLQNVGSNERGKSPYGVYDMAGNVWEWVQDTYAEDYYLNSPLENPQGPTRGGNKVVRGGASHNPEYVRSAFRNVSQPNDRNHDHGFRCAQEAF